MWSRDFFEMRARHILETSSGSEGTQDYQVHVCVCTRAQLVMYGYDKMSLLARATFRNKGVKWWVKRNSDNNFWVYCTTQNKVIEK